MILGQHNPLKFTSDKRSRIWENSGDYENKELDIVYYETGIMPEFQLMVDSVPIDEIVSVQVFDVVTGDEIYSISSILVTSWDQSVYLITFNNIDTIIDVPITGATQGRYEIKVTCGSDIYWSDVFAWIDDPDEWEDETKKLLKVRATSSNIRIGDNKSYSDNLIYEFYLNADPLSIKPEIDSVGKTQNGAMRTTFGARIIRREFDISATEPIYVFLSSLQLLRSNGEVKFMWQYEEFTASDILIEEKDNHNGGYYQIKLSFVDEKEIISMING